MVAQGNGPASLFLGGTVQHAAAHTGTQAAGVRLLSFLKDDFPKPGAADDVGYPQRGTPIGQGGEIRFPAADAGIQRNGGQSERDRIKTAQRRQRRQQGGAVLAA